MKHILKHTFRVWWSVLLATGLLCGCASTKQFVPKPSVEKPTPDKALIVVERVPTTFGGNVGIKVYDNNTLVGEMGSRGRLIWLRDPGLMRIHFSANNWIKSSADDAAPERWLAVEAGERYSYANNFLMSSGPGIQAFNYVTEDQSSKGSLILFRVLDKKKTAGVARTLKITNIQSGKLIPIDVDVFSGESPWLEHLTIEKP